jgi:chromosome segregation ATPase
MTTSSFDEFTARLKGWRSRAELQAEIRQLRRGLAIERQRVPANDYQAELEAEAEQLRERHDRYKAHTEGLTEECRELRRELETARANYAEAFAAKESLVAEVERLRRTNSELVDTHNKGVVDRAKLKTELERRDDLIRGVTQQLRNAWESLEVLNADERRLAGEARTGNGSVKRPERVGEAD